MRPTRIVPLALAGLLLAACTASARPSFHPGLEAGWQSSTLDYDEPMDIWDPGWANTFTGGATLDVPIARGIGLASGARYVCYSNHVTFTGLLDLEGQFRLRANYLAVPVLVRFAPHPVGPRLGLGTEVAFLTSARIAGEEHLPLPGPFGSLTSYDDIRRDLQPVDVSLCATLGWAVPFDRHAAIAQLRFTRGLTGAAKDEDWVTNWKTVGVDGTLGVQW